MGHLPGEAPTPNRQSGGSGPRPAGRNRHGLAGLRVLSMVLLFRARLGLFRNARLGDQKHFRR
eukprot:11862722-Alexandrium_andersonii.AAC.1